MGRFRVLTMPFLRKLGICFTLIFLAEVPLSLMVLRRGLDDALAAGFTASRANFPARQHKSHRREKSSSSGVMRSRVMLNRH